MSKVARWSYTNTATVWPSTGETDHLAGGTVFGDPYQIACTWIADSKRMTDNNGREFISSCVFFHEDPRVNDGDRILRGVSAVVNPLEAGAELIKYHREWDMSMFKSKGVRDIPDFRSAV